MSRSVSKSRLLPAAALLLAAGTLAAIAGFTSAGTPNAGDKLIPFIALLNSGQESAQPDSDAVGVAFLYYDVKTAGLTYTISYQGLEGTESASHIHGPAGPGEDAPVLIDFQNSANPKNGCVTLSKTEFKMLRKGQLYINIHSDMFAPGEIRGQILPVKGLGYKFVGGS